MLADDTRRTVMGYFSAWTTHRVDDASSYLAADLHFSGPTASYNSAAEFRPALESFASMTKAARIVELLVEGNRAALLYDCDLPDPVGTLRIASFFMVNEGRITAYDTRFDATELSQLRR